MLNFFICFGFQSILIPSVFCFLIIKIKRNLPIIKGSIGSLKKNFIFTNIQITKLHILFFIISGAVSNF